MAKKKGSKVANIIERILIVFFALIFLVSATFFVFYLLQYKKGTDTYNDLRQFVEMPEPVENRHPEDPENFPKIDFEGLAEINPDILAWIYSPDSQINYPVVNGRDNEYYLTHLFTKTVNKAGAIFMDMNNKTDFSDVNTILYGHNMSNKSMFSVLMNYKEQSYYEEHPVMYIITPEKTYLVELYTGYVTSAIEDRSSWRVWFSGSTDIASWVNWSKSRSMFKTDVTVTSEDKFLTLSTCTYEYDDARYIVAGKLIEIAQPV